MPSEQASAGGRSARRLARGPGPSVLRALTSLRRVWGEKPRSTRQCSLTIAARGRVLACQTIGPRDVRLPFDAYGNLVSADAHRQRSRAQARAARHLTVAYVET